MTYHRIYIPSLAAAQLCLWNLCRRHQDKPALAAVASYYFWSLYIKNQKKLLHFETHYRIYLPSLAIITSVWLWNDYKRKINKKPNSYDEKGDLENIDQKLQYQNNCDTIPKNLPLNELEDDNNSKQQSESSKKKISLQFQSQQNLENKKQQLSQSNENLQNNFQILEQENSLQQRNQQNLKVENHQMSQSIERSVKEKSLLIQNLEDEKQQLSQSNEKVQNNIQKTEKSKENGDEIKFFHDKVYQILNENFYKPSFKSRQIQDEFLKKFVRDYLSVAEYQQEYNLGKNQEELLKQHIHYFIPIRGDGNCLFTSLGLQFIFFNMIDDNRYAKLFQLIKQTEFIQNFDNQKAVTQDDECIILRGVFKSQLRQLKVISKDNDQLLRNIGDYLNNDEGPFYGLLIIFMRNYFRKLLQNFYDNNEMNFLIQNPEKITEILTWEFMYDETDIALKIFATEEKMQNIHFISLSLIRCYQKMNVDDKIVQISEYKADDQVKFQYKIGLAFQPGHYNAILLKD